MKAGKREWWDRTGPEMAATFGVTDAMISIWVSEGAPKIAHNSYDQRAFVQWVRSRDKQHNTATLAEAQARLTNNKADLAEIELAQQRGELVPLSEIREEHGRILVAARNKFLALPMKCARRVIACKTVGEAKQILDDAAWEALDELSRFNLSTIADADASKAGTTTTTHSKPVVGQKSRAQPGKRSRTRKVAD